MFAFQLPDSIANYYTLRNNAERKILSRDFRSAVEMYTSALEYKYPNERDVYNAFRAALLTNDSVLGRKFFNIITANGQTREKLENTPFVKSIKNTTFYQYISMDYDSIYPKKLSVQKTIMISLLDSIYRIDQDGRTKNPVVGDERKKSIRNADSIAVALMINLIKEYGFPSYQRVGIFENIKYGFGAGESTLDLIFWHMWRSGKSSSELSELAYNALIDGDLPPEDYAFYIDGQRKEKIYYAMLSRTDADDYTLEGIFDIAEIDKRREGIGLYSLSEFRNRLTFFRETKEQPELQFRFLSSLNYLVNLMPVGFDY